jgi:hypothetical protein
MGDFFSGEENLSPLWMDQAHDDIKSSGLASSVGPQKADDLPGPEF